MPEPRRLTVIEGGTSDPAQRTYIDTGVVNERGDPVFRVSGGAGGNGGGGDMTPLWKLDITRDVQIAKWGLVGLGGISLAAFWFVLNQIDTRFDRADEKVSTLTEQVSTVRENVASQTTLMEGVKDNLDKIESKLDGRPAKPKDGT